MASSNDGRRRGDEEGDGWFIVVGVVVMVVNASGVVASSRRDCHNTGRELLTRVRRASHLSRVGELHLNLHRSTHRYMIIVLLREYLSEGRGSENA